VTATGFLPGETVDITLHSTPVVLGSVVTIDGTVTFTFTVPADLEPGQHRVELVGRRSAVRVSIGFEVIGVTDPDTLPVTGIATGSPAAGGLALLVVGTALLTAGNRRRRRLAGA
jgi:hypothetical protein